MDLGKWTSRGMGTCPSCKSPYRTAWKPKTCAKCSYELGGHYVPKPKRSKLENPECVVLMNEEGMTIYSVKTSPRGDRCFAIKDENGSFCHHPTCKESRSISVTDSERRLVDFSCQHLKALEKAIRPEEEWVINKETVELYPCDLNAKESLYVNIIDNERLKGWPSVIKVATNVFVVCGPPTSSSPIGFTHVIRGKQDSYRCTARDCRTLAYQGSCKQQKHKKFCFHQHALLCVLNKEKNKVTMDQASCTTIMPGPSTSGASISESTSHLSCATPSSEQIRQNALKANSQRSLPYEIPKHWLSHAKRCDALTNLGLEGGWPLIFQPEETSCRLCSSPLGEAKQHPGSQGKSVIMTNGNPFHICCVKVKSCRSQECKALHQVWPVEAGLFNVCDKILVALEVLLEWRELFKRGVPISTAIESKLAGWCKQCPKEILPSSSEINYWSRLLYNSFYYFEIIVERSLDDTICGLCGVIGEFYLGDGNEKNCCSLKGVKYDEPSTTDCCPTTLEEFLESLKATWHEKNVFAKANQGDKIFDASSVPPIIAPAFRGKCVYNTEMKKKSVYLQSGKKATQGDPALLHHLIISQNLDMTSIETINVEDLKELAKKCSISLPLGASKSFIVGEINALYAHLLVGNSPCHGFNKVPGNTGGFYHIVCRHGNLSGMQQIYTYHCVILLLSLFVIRLVDLQDTWM